jgi:flavodoxin
MRTAVIYDSQFGNTRQLAEVIAAELEGAGAVQLANVRTDTIEIPPHLDLLIVAGPTQVHGVSAPMREFLQGSSLPRLDGVPVAIFDTRARGPQLLTGSASKGIASQLKKHGGKVIGEPESFTVVDKEGPLADGELERARVWARDVLDVVREAPTHSNPATAPTILSLI